MIYKLLELFRGREDVVAIGNEKGFAPQHRSPRGDDIQAHLAGRRAAGFYLLTADSKCYVAALDFDNHGGENPDWRDQVETCYHFLAQSGLLPLVEISQSGEGAHVWLFFSEPVNAWLPRQFFAKLLEKVGLTDVEIYPRQDKLAKDGLGNLIRYPLFNQSRFVNVEDDFAEVKPEEALADVEPLSGGDLKYLAFEVGFGSLDSPRFCFTVADALPLRVERMLERRHTLLSRRWHGDTSDLKDKSRSAVALSIACELVRLYVPTPEIDRCLAKWCADNDYAKGERDDWRARTIQKAYECLTSRDEQKATSTSTLKSAAHAYLDTLEHRETSHVPTGVDGLDESFEGVGFGEVAVVAGRPGEGKSAFALQWSQNAAQLAIPTLIISEEMSDLELGKRVLHTAVKAGEEHWRDVLPHLRVEVDGYFESQAPVYLAHAGTIDAAEKLIAAHVNAYGVRMVAIDYLQLLGTSKSSGRYEVVSEVSRRLKVCAQHHNVAMLNLSQMNRQSENRSGLPNLSDLRDSGSIEQDADMVLFVSYRGARDENNGDVFRVFCAKRRNGAVKKRVVELRFDADRQRISAPLIKLNRHAR